MRGHKLVRVVNAPEGWTGQCECEKWVGAARTKPGLAAKHYGHVQEKTERKR